MTTTPENALPTGDESGSEDTWHLPTSTPSTDDPDVRDGFITFEGLFLGVGSSRRVHHADHAGEVAERGERCGRCRWFETRIFKLGSNDYLIHQTGRTIVADEKQLTRHERAYSPDEVVESYVVRRPDEDRTFLTRPAARALAQASAFDDDLRAAYIRRGEELAASSVLRRLESRFDDAEELDEAPRRRAP